MKTVLLLGAGKSASYLIDYFADLAHKEACHFWIADLSVAHLEPILATKKGIKLIPLDSGNMTQRRDIIQNSDLVISMLPAFMHPEVARDCVDFGKHFFSASYESDAMRALKPEIESKGLFFLNECGLDPGIDHMSAMKIILEAKQKGEEIRSFKSYCGGLLAPQSEDNPWKYKFTWNPRNVVLAGQGTSRYMDQGELKLVPYHQLFRRVDEVSFVGLGKFDGYPNRDSLSYRSVYGLENIPTILRGTLRRQGFCRAWDVFVQLGMTDDSYQLSLPEHTTYRQFLNAFLPWDEAKSVEEKLADLIPDFDFPTFEKLQWLGFFESIPLPKTEGSPAQLLQHILEQNWALESEDQDMIVMQHQFEIQTERGIKKITSSLVEIGKNERHTAMAKTVGLPLAIAVDLFLQQKINLRGLHLPVFPELFDPILKQLESFGIRFTETVIES